MLVKLENLTRRPVSLRCNSGAVVRLAPCATSPSMPESEIEGNAMGDKLVARRIVAVRPGRKPRATASPRRKKTAAKKSRKNKTQ